MQHSPVISSFYKEYLKIDRSFTLETVGLSWIRAELNKFEERVRYFLSSISAMEQLVLLDLYHDLYFKVIACLCYYGGGNEMSLNYLYAAERN